MSSTIAIEIKNLDEVREYFRSRPALVVGELARATTRSGLIIQRMSREEAPTDVGRLRNSIRIQKLFGGGVAVGPDTSYAVAVHEGTRPHMPPIKAITGREESLDLWARRHGFASAWPIAKAIARRGTKANKYMERAASRGTDDVQREFDKAVDRIVESI
jgi:hypothetical protein